MSKSYCPSCAVEVESRLKFCPLCDDDLQAEMPEVSGEYPRDIPDQEVELPVSYGVKRAWSMLAVSLLGVIAMMICGVVNMVQNSSQSWASYVHLGVLGAIGMLAIWFYLWGRPLVLFGGLMLVVALLTVGLDNVTPPLTWSTEVALPIWGVFTACFGGWLYLVLRLRLPRSLVAITAMAPIGVFCVLLDLLVQGSPEKGFGWSMPVVICLIVVMAGLTIARHYIVRNPRWQRLMDL